MSKIGTITFHRAINFGGVLQTYALHKFLVQNGVENEVIDYRCSKIEKSYEPIQKSGNIFKTAIRTLTVSPMIYSKNKSFRKFVNNNIKLSEPCYSINDLKKIENKYSSFITGSDQVFTDNWTGFDEAYFLSFVEDTRKKNSYAASFGTTKIPTHLEEKYRNRLNKFNKFSVREESAKNILQKICNCESEIHIDPTFLISNEEWEKICVHVKHKNYLLLYTLGKGKHVDEIIEHAKKVAKEKKIKIIYINDKYYKSNNKIKYVAGKSPEYFVSLFKNANYVVTNSFHGTAFSIIFNKEFSTSSNMPNGLGTRIVNLLKILSLEKQDIAQGAYGKEKINNWDDVNNSIILEKERAKKYLLNLL